MLDSNPEPSGCEATVLTPTHCAPPSWLHEVTVMEAVCQSCAVTPSPTQITHSLIYPTLEPLSMCKHSPHTGALSDLLLGFEVGSG